MDAAPGVNGHVDLPRSVESLEGHEGNETQQTVDKTRAQIKAILAGIPQLVFKQRLTPDEQTRIARALGDLEDRGLSTEQEMFQVQKELNIHPARINDLKKDEKLPYKNLSLIESAAMASALKIFEDYLPTRSPGSRAAYPDRIRKAIVIYGRYLKRETFSDTSKILVEKGIGLSMYIRLKKEYHGQSSRDMLPDIYPPVETPTAEDPVEHTVPAESEGDLPTVTPATPVERTLPSSESINPEPIPSTPESAPAQPNEFEMQMKAQLETGERLIGEISSLRQQVEEIISNKLLPAIAARTEMTPPTPVQTQNAGEHTVVNFGGAQIVLGAGKRMVIIEG